MDYLDLLVCVFALGCTSLPQECFREYVANDHCCSSFVLRVLGREPGGCCVVWSPVVVCLSPSPFGFAAVVRSAFVVVDDSTPSAAVVRSAFVVDGGSTPIA